MVVELPFLPNLCKRHRCLFVNSLKIMKKLSGTQYNLKYLASHWVSLKLALKFWFIEKIWVKTLSTFFDMFEKWCTLEDRLVSYCHHKICFIYVIQLKGLQ